jgi:hypothetical protein
MDDFNEVPQEIQAFRVEVVDILNDPTNEWKNSLPEALWQARGRRDDEEPGQRLPADRASYHWLPTSQACAACNKPSAKVSCSSCLTIVEKHVVFETSYCSEACQTAHRAKHQPVCKDWVATYRAATMLRSMFSHLLTQFNEMEITAVAERDGFLAVELGSTLHEHAYGGHLFRPLPQRFFGSQQQKLLVTMLRQCHAATEFGVFFADILFRGACSSIPCSSQMPESSTSRS